MGFLPTDRLMTASSFFFKPVLATCGVVRSQDGIELSLEGVLADGAEQVGQVLELDGAVALFVEQVEGVLGL